ncbi:MAG: hypothetical protein IJE44_00650 [Clostridia bacterium]|nr:hypothetical protein [Clostridia bacterium]
MKKVLALILALVLVLSFASCKKDDVKEPEKDETKVEDTIKDEETEVPEETEKEEEKKEETQKPAEKPEEKPAEKPAEKPEEKPAEQPKTLGTALLADFKAAAKAGKSTEEIVNVLCQNSKIEFSAVTNPVAVGDYLPGFDGEEIKGFKSGVAFMPMIGSIPFVGYVFELENAGDTASFIQTLKSQANLRWLVCAEAEEMVYGAEGNKVFFVMCPKGE